MNITDLLGTMVQQGMSKSSNKRLENVFGQGGREGGLMDELGDLLGKGASQGGGLADKLGGLLGGLKDGKSGSSGGGLADMLGEVLGGGSRSQQSQKGGGLGDLLGGLLGGGEDRSVQQSSRDRSVQGSGGGLSDLLGGLLGGGSGKGLGSNKNLALGSLAALAAAVLGGKGGFKKAMGGGALAMLATMAFSALKKGGHRNAQVPLGLRAPENDIEVRELENNASLILTSMLNAAKADGQIDKEEVQKILGQAKEEGMDRETQEFIMAELKKPIDLNGLCAQARHQPELAAQLYAASLLAIEVDTKAEQSYLQQLGQGLGLDRATLQQLHTMVGVA